MTSWSEQEAETVRLPCEGQMLDKVGGRSSSDTAVSVGDGGPASGGGEAGGTGGAGEGGGAMTGGRGAERQWRPGGGRTEGSLWRAIPSEEVPGMGDLGV